MRLIARLEGRASVRLNCRATPGYESFRDAIAPGAVMTVQGGFFLVLDDLAVELVDQAVDRGVHVLVRALAEDVAPRDVDVGFRLLLQLVHREDNHHVDDMIEMTGDPFQLGGNVTADGGSNV